MIPRWTLLSLTALALGTAHCAGSDPPPAPPPDDSANVHENHPGTLAITAPARAAFLSDDGKPVTVTGTGASSALTLNGQPVSVNADGTFSTTVTPSTGLNVLAFADGDAKLETSFLYGHYEKITTAVPQAVALRLSAAGIGGGDGSANAPAVSLAGIAEKALADRDLLEAMRGQTFTGSLPLGGSWSYDVTGGKYGAPRVGVSPQSGGVHVAASLDSIEVDGNLTVDYFGAKLSGPVEMTADRADIQGDVDLSVGRAAGALRAGMPDAKGALDNFQYHSHNAGFPCCVDSIMTGLLRPHVESAFNDAIKTHVPSAIEVTLGGFGLPKSLDLSSVGTGLLLPVATQFDGSSFDPQGGMLTASVLFGGGGAFRPDEPGSKAPGWLHAGSTIEDLSGAANVDVSLSLDAINQLFFMVWGRGVLVMKKDSVGPVTDLNVAPALPPLLLANESGGVRLEVGELVVSGKLQEKPFTVAVSIVQDLKASAAAQSLTLTPDGKPSIGITWLDAKDIDPATRDIMVGAAESQIDQLIKPIQLPIPGIPLDAVASAFKGQSLGVGTPAIGIDKSSARVALSGDLAILGSSAH